MVDVPRKTSGDGADKVAAHVLVCLLSIRATLFVSIIFARSSNGRTTVSGTVNWGSNPCRAAVMGDRLRLLNQSYFSTYFKNGSWARNFVIFAKFRKVIFKAV